MFHGRAQPERPAQIGLFASGAENTGCYAALSIVDKVNGIVAESSRPSGVLTGDFLFHVTQPVLAEEKFRAHEEAGAAEHAALDRFGGVLEELALDLRRLGQRHQSVGIE